MNIIFFTSDRSSWFRKFQIKTLIDEIPTLLLLRYIRRVNSWIFKRGRGLLTYHENTVENQLLRLKRRPWNPHAVCHKVYTSLGKLSSKLKASLDKKSNTLSHSRVALIFRCHRNGYFLGMKLQKHSQVLESCLRVTAISLLKLNYVLRWVVP